MEYIVKSILLIITSGFLIKIITSFNAISLDKAYYKVCSVKERGKDILINSTLLTFSLINFCLGIFGLIDGILSLI